ncbi:hypothetical protein PCC7424_2410 [Gloeothece citriformis PCC 7424]|uniref:Uncharacterized protein n=1 Tax=Gloeothece citriformis (strain PCC 7424) TaxID=65393 RepID=B7KIZ5_GLOC7|nr:hypothetical protein [Gloeothece citriformis]ACK70831.1 hypothetical protein PCC7424_2410 [Gloeothece citriformis PCC 7424]
MKRVLCYQELVFHQQHYINLLNSGQVEPQAHSLIHWHINKLTREINERWPGWGRKANAI